uniref:Uncharacterized protein n=1 Tax=Helianthus annuus TaxID=4232 RepID=A0A251SE28_HELAN
MTNILLFLIEVPIIEEFIYIFGGWCPNSWKGFTVAAFKDLVPVIKLSISSGIMLCLEKFMGVMDKVNNWRKALAAIANIYTWLAYHGRQRGYRLSSGCIKIITEFGSNT